MSSIYKDDGSGSWGTSTPTDETPGGLSCGPLSYDCNDPAFAAAHPDLCGGGGGSGTPATLLLTPATASINMGQRIQFATVFRSNGKDIPVSAGVTYSSSNGAVASIDSTGKATGVGGGVCTITAQWHEYTALAQLTTVDTCGSVAVMLVIDTSKSFSQPFGGSYASKLAYAKSAATTFVGSSNMENVSIGVVGFNTTQITFSPTNSQPTVTGHLSSLSQSEALTDIGSALQAAATALDYMSASKKAIVLISDGLSHIPDGVSAPNPVIVADAFKAQGNIIVSLGVRTYGEGYIKMRQLATPGYFLNAYAETGDSVAQICAGLRGYFCAAPCVPPNYMETCLEVPPTVQEEDPAPLDDNETSAPPKREWTVTTQKTKCCSSGYSGGCVTRSGTYTSNVSEADAALHAEALANAACQAALDDLCCKSYPILINDADKASPYPSCIEVVGGPTSIVNTKAILEGFQHRSPHDVVIVLTSPAGTAVKLMQHCGSMDIPTSGDVTLTFDQSAENPVPGSTAERGEGAIVTGSFRPASYGPAVPVPDPGPSLPYADSMDAFRGEDANGFWRLFVIDDLGQDAGAIKSWRLTFDDAPTNPNIPPVLQIDGWEYVAPQLTACSDCAPALPASIEWDGRLIQSGGGVEQQWILDQTHGQAYRVAGTNFTSAFLSVAYSGNTPWWWISLCCGTKSGPTTALWVGRKDGGTDATGRYEWYSDPLIGTPCNNGPAYINVIAAPPPE